MQPQPVKAFPVESGVAHRHALDVGGGSVDGLRIQSVTKDNVNGSHGRNVIAPAIAGVERAVRLMMR